MPHLTRNQLRQIDHRSLTDYHIPSIILMENAARAVVEQASIMLGGEYDCTVLILCGGGNNGGDGLAIARHLHNRGTNVSIGLTIDPATYNGDALINWNITQSMKISTRPFEDSMLKTPRPMLVIDAVFGTGLTKPPRDPFAAMAYAIQQSDVPVLAVDVPSGMDCDTGLPPGVCIHAHRTVTFIAEKIGFLQPTARQYLGTVIVGDIGCPTELIKSIAANP